MTCYSCHTSWTPTCFGCHLQMTANARKPMLHNEGLLTKNYTSYNVQVLRDDIYMLGVDGTVTGHRIAPARSSCAVLVSSQNPNRDWLYYTQQTISSPGFSGQAFSTFVPHTVRAKETRQCSDCHVSANNDNNAWMAQLKFVPCNSNCAIQALLSLFAETWPSPPSSRTRCAPKKPGSAAIATFPQTTTTTPGWRNCCCRERTS